jgi:hypothetical protein
MLRLMGINAVTVLSFVGAYGATAAGLLAQGAFLAALVVLFVVFTALWIKVEGSGTGSRDPMSRFGRIAAAFVVVAIAIPGLTLMPLFALQDHLPREAGVGEVIPGVMVILLASLALGALVNLAGLAITIVQALLLRARAR